MLQTPVKKRRKRRRLLVLCCTFFLVSGLSARLLWNRKPASIKETEAGIEKGTINPPKSGSADNGSAEPVLRGTIYDRHYRELAVSYPLYSLHIRPAEVKNPNKTAKLLAEHLDREESMLRSEIQERHPNITLADNLDQDQIGEIQSLQLPGIFCTSTEHRYYPNHEIAAHLLGFMEDDLGLVGIEGRFNHILQPGVYQTDTIPEIDFKEKQSAGVKGTDLVLTLDMELQKLLTDQLSSLLGAQNPDKAEALLLDIKSGGILAMVNLPSFNPNYFWKADLNQQENRIVENQLPVELYKNLLFRAAAIAKSGDVGPSVLPATVAAPDYNLTADDLTEFIAGTEIHDPVQFDFAPTQNAAHQKAKNSTSNKPGPTSALKLLATIASLQNGGTEIMPHLLSAVHDRQKDVLYPFVKASQYEQGLYRVLSPTLGVRMRMNLFDTNEFKTKNSASITGSTATVNTTGQGTCSSYSMQDILISMIPRQRPRFALLITRKHESLLPRTKREKPNTRQWKQFSRKTVAALCQRLQGDHDNTAVFPAVKNRSNFNRFLISKRMTVAPEAVPFNFTTYDMPEIKGMSLRKGLQALAGRNLFVRIHGSGRIVSQHPKPGTKLKDVRECILELEPPI